MPFVIENKRVYFAAFNPLGFRWIVPPDDYNSMLFKQAKASFVTGKPILRYIKTKKEKLYSLSISSPESNDVCYLTFLSLEGLEKEIERRKIYIGISAFIALILSITIIIWLFKQLIMPLDNLEEGAKALEKQQYELKLSVPPGNDELAQLFKEFNYMMGENYDMQMAKNIQDGLITQNFPQINNRTITSERY